MKYKPGTFSITPNKELMRGKPTEMQTIYFWLCDRADEDGICFPSRPKIAEDSGIKSVRTVDKYITELENLGILTKIKGHEGRSNRYQIMLVEPVQEMHRATDDTGTPATNAPTPAPNDTVTIPNNNTQLTIPTKEAKPQVAEQPKVNAGKLLTVYSMLWKNKTGFDYKPSYGKDSVMLKRLLSKYTEAQVLVLMIIFFNWYGMDGANEKEYRSVVESGFNLGWFISQIPKYEMYARNVAGINMDDSDKVLDFVANHMQSII